MYIIPCFADLQKRGASVKIVSLVPSSSGLGRLVLIQKIEGSTPSGITTPELLPSQDSFFVVNYSVKWVKFVCSKLFLFDIVVAGHKTDMMSFIW